MSPPNNQNVGNQNRIRAVQWEKSAKGKEKEKKSQTPVAKIPPNPFVNAQGMPHPWLQQGLQGLQGFPGLPGTTPQSPIKNQPTADDQLMAFNQNLTAAAHGVLEDLNRGIDLGPTQAKDAHMDHPDQVALGTKLGADKQK